MAQKRKKTENLCKLKERNISCLCLNSYMVVAFYRPMQVIKKYKLQCENDEKMVVEVAGHVLENG